MSHFKSLLFVVLFSVVSSGLLAQDNDYLKHRKFFDICTIKKQCSGCYSCGQERYIVKILNKSDKKINGVFIKFYSPVFNKIVEKEFIIQGKKIDPKSTGIVYACVLDVRHWIFSKIVYTDESSVTFKLNERMENYLQEPDECDCNE